jgi:hypothetical protein
MARASTSLSAAKHSEIRETSRPLRVTDGCADNISGTSEVPQLADPLSATRKSAEAGQQETWPAAIDLGLRFIGS